MDLNSEVARFSAAQHSAPPNRLGKRYDVSGFLPEAGNTVVCALDTRDPVHQAVLTARDRMIALPAAHKLLFTPASSLHMTLFEGVIETRRTDDAWPEGMDRDAPVDAVTQALATRLSGFSPPPPFAVRVAGIRPSGLILAGATPEDAARLTTWRTALTHPFGYRHTEHASYTFHMTFAYPLQWLSAGEVAAWQEGLSAILADLAATAPIIPLEPPAFCQFADMTRFTPVLALAR